ncbi:hypothetical protein L3V83_02650 [Thiotrichales bacterium 19X7-9]|nr:hypothetical protein [Thiotrichales bacterium 19X7-9]
MKKNIIISIILSGFSINIYANESHLQTKTIDSSYSIKFKYINNNHLNKKKLINLNSYIQKSKGEVYIFKSINLGKIKLTYKNTKTQIKHFKNIYYLNKKSDYQISFNRIYKNCLLKNGTISCPSSIYHKDIKINSMKYETIFLCHHTTLSTPRCPRITLT